MGQGKRYDIDGWRSVPCFYGKELRFQREKAGLSLAQLVEGSFYGVTYLSEIERGNRRMPVDLARHVDQALKTDGYFERCCEDVRKARQGAHASYFAPIAEAETRARVIEEWACALIPGLLQTATYARAIIHATHPLNLEEEVGAKIRDRLARARLFDDCKRPEYWVIFHESQVWHPLVAPEDMAAQLDHIATLAQRRRVVLQVLPWNAATHPFTAMSLTFMEFDDEPPFVYTEGPYHGQILDDPGLVKRYRRAYDRLRAAALAPEASLAMIEQASEDYRNGKQPRWVEGRPLA
ncbi:helix-turn-helix transcriptional regulator [Streptomyces sp. MUM 203J]|uniref:helix-turn-helix domain-containing protein n=1 Tax=Streptomyces sp. MUM 203J TaxID=2791990 RepID=UPI001F04391E|nr:helix-turn-helix transcriptional regulator [Streptomyces sp. MUM 203J]MCH0540403.1 helix-turn-helix transcriptional regulator [Streptomyces sp. MUM 203J]